VHKHAVMWLTEEAIVDLALIYRMMFFIFVSVFDPIT
jgi:hypothetical protein